MRAYPDVTNFWIVDLHYLFPFFKKSFF